MNDLTTVKMPADHQSAGGTSDTNAILSVPRANGEQQMNMNNCRFRATNNETIVGCFRLQPVPKKKRSETSVLSVFSFKPCTVEHSPRIDPRGNTVCRCKHPLQLT